MTVSRRGFLGVLAAAPVVGASIAKAAATATPEMSFGVAGEWAEVGTLELKGIGDSMAGRVAIFDHAKPNEKLSKLLRSPSPWDEVPNRLFGAYVKEDGDVA